MAQRDSGMFNFIKVALMDEKYPNMKWINREERTINLYCPLKSKNYWKPLYEQIFDDYAKLKPRKSSDNRQRFLQAMKASPFVSLIKNISSSENKYYQLWEHGRSSVNAAEEIDAIIAEEVGEIEIDDLQAIQLSDTSKSGPSTGGASVGNNGNDLGNISSPLPVDTSDSPEEVPIAFNYNEEIHKDIHELLIRVNGLEDDVLVNEGNCLTPLLADSNNLLPDTFGNDDVKSRLSEQEISSLEDYMMVPAEGNLESPENTATAFFDPNVLPKDTVNCNEVKNNSNPYILGEEESSYSFVPPDYDPEKELLQSCVIPAKIEINSSPAIPKADFDQIGSVQMMPSTSEESSKCEVAGMFRLNDNDDIVKHLQQNSASVGDNREKRYFMMVLKPGKM